MADEHQAEAEKAPGVDHGTIVYLMVTQNTLCTRYKQTRFLNHLKFATAFNIGNCL